jgi:hypothetical protein
MAIREISKEIQSQIYRESNKSVKALIVSRFNAIKNEMIRDFEMHPVTIELDGGPSASNTSGTLTRGNLFSFIGFTDGDRPTDVIRRELMDSDVTVTRSSTGHFSINFTIPEKEDLFDKTPMPWATGRSWLKGVEHGISGLGRYLYGEFGGTSRSGAAIQTKNSLGSGGKFRNTSYMSSILFKAKRKLERMDKVKI